MTTEKRENEHSCAFDCCRAVQLLEDLGRAGFIISIAYGMCGDYGLQYSVTALNSQLKEVWHKPFAFTHFADLEQVLRNELLPLLSR